MTQDNFQLVAEQAMAAQQPRVFTDASGDSKPFVIIPEGYAVHDIEQLFPSPQRKRGSRNFKDVGSFIRWIAEHQTEATHVFGDKLKPSFKAVFNDNAATPGWGDFIASYACPLSTEWKKWSGHDGKVMTQADFAKFIEDNSLDCRLPASADMIEISRSLEAKKKVNFASAIRLSDGQTQFTYEEDIQGTASKGRLSVPETFEIAIPVLEGGDLYALSCRLRYRIADGKLVMWFDLERPHKILEAAANQVWADIEKGTGLVIFHGE